MTEYTKATNAVEDLEALLLKSEPDPAQVVALFEGIEEAFPKFEKRMELKLYGEKMIEKVKALSARFELMRPRVEVLKAAIGDARAAKAATDEAVQAAAEKAAAAKAAAEKAAAEKAAAEKSAEKAAAEKAAAEKAASENVAPPPAKAARVEAPAPPHAPPLPHARSARTVALSRKMVEMVASALGVNPDASLSRPEVEKLLTALVLARLSSRKEEDEPARLREISGWQRWAHLEAQAGFLLMDADGSGSVDYSEFVSFVATCPHIFGPLVHIEQLFDAYDTNHDDLLDADEVHCLHVEVVIEHETREDGSTDHVIPMATERSLAMLRAYGSAASPRHPMGALDFFGFVKAVYDDPHLLGTAANLRRLFKQFDTDDSGALERTELRDMVLYHCELKGLPPPPPPELDRYVEGAFAKADTDGSGTIDFPELCKFVATSEMTLNLLPAAFAPVSPFEVLRKASTPASGSHFALAKQLAAQPVKGLDALPPDSFLVQLMHQKGQALGLTDPRRPSIEACAVCSAPLVGNKMGSAYLGFAFCGDSCKVKMANDVNFVKYRAGEHARMQGIATSDGAGGIRRLDDAIREDWYTHTPSSTLARGGFNPQQKRPEIVAEEWRRRARGAGNNGQECCIS